MATIIGENIKNILKDKRLKEKIKNNYQDYVIFMKETTYEDYEKDTLNNIRNGDINTILLYMKKPSRMNIFEPIQIEIMEKILHTKFKRHNVESFKNTKTFDGISEDGKVILQCKYIKQSGGAQDNQFNDLIKFNTKQDKYENYLIISGTYGIQLMRKYLNNNLLKSDIK